MIEYHHNKNVLQLICINHTQFMEPVKLIDNLAYW